MVPVHVLQDLQDLRTNTSEADLLLKPLLQCFWGFFLFYSASKTNIPTSISEFFYPKFEVSLQLAFHENLHFHEGLSSLGV